MSMKKTSLSRLLPLLPALFLGFVATVEAGPPAFEPAKIFCQIARQKAFSVENPELNMRDHLAKFLGEKAFRDPAGGELTVPALIGFSKGEGVDWKVLEEGMRITFNFKGGDGALTASYLLKKADLENDYTDHQYNAQRGSPFLLDGGLKLKSGEIIPEADILSALVRAYLFIRPRALAAAMSSAADN